MLFRSEEEKFVVGKNPMVYGWDLSSSASMVFETEEEAVRFYATSRDLGYTFTDGLRGRYPMRVTKDATYDVRARNQVFHLLKESAKKALCEGEKWKEMPPDSIQIRDTGVRGVVFLDSGVELYELFKVNVSDKGGVGIITPMYDTLKWWSLESEMADALVNELLRTASLLDRRI